MLLSNSLRIAPEDMDIETLMDPESDTLTREQSYSLKNSLRDLLLVLLAALLLRCPCRRPPPPPGAGRGSRSPAPAAGPSRNTRRCSRRVFFRPARRKIAGILGVLQDFLTRQGGKRPVQAACGEIFGIPGDEAAVKVIGGDKADLAEVAALLFAQYLAHRPRQMGGKALPEFFSRRPTSSASPWWRWWTPARTSTSAPPPRKSGSSSRAFYIEPPASSSAASSTSSRSRREFLRE